MLDSDQPKEINFQNSVFAGVAGSLADCPRAGLPEIILSGRSNVGKSTLINALVGGRHLARVSSTPGKTRLIVYFNIDGKVLLTDLPGYGYSQAAKTSQAAYSELADRYLNSGRPIALFLHLLDIRHSPTREDRLMLDWLEAKGMPYRILLSKADKLARSRVFQARADMAAMLGLADASCLLPISAKTGLGFADLKNLIASMILAG